MRSELDASIPPQAALAKTETLFMALALAAPHPLVPALFRRMAAKEGARAKGRVQGILLLGLTFALFMAGLAGPLARSSSAVPPQAAPSESSSSSSPTLHSASTLTSSSASASVSAATSLPLPAPAAPPADPPTDPPAFLGVFDAEKTNVFVALAVFGCFFFLFLGLSRAKRPLYLRRIPGIDAMEEAVGRATEMGRPILFVPGLEDINEIQTLAGIAVLSHVAKIVAQYDSQIIVPTRRAIVLSVCEETVKEAFAAAGRPDAYRADNLLYLSDEQFAYTAGVNGIMLRRKPAANIYMGAFFSESLILAETGHSSGAIQVAGTAMIWQIPFFVASCDYTLIAEEFFAASAYLSKDPRTLSSIKASDYFKVIVIGVLAAGLLAAAFAPKWLKILQFWF